MDDVHLKTDKESKSDGYCNGFKETTENHVEESAVQNDLIDPSDSLDNMSGSLMKPSGDNLHTEPDDEEAEGTAHKPRERFCLKSRDSEEVMMLSLPDETDISCEDSEAPEAHLVMVNNYFKGNFHIRNENVCSVKQNESNHHVGQCNSVNTRSDDKKSDVATEGGPRECWLPDSDHGDLVEKVFSSSPRQCGCENSIFASLPDELLVKIFSYLTIKELCLRAAKVCRKWRDISHDHSLWKTLNFSSNPHMSSVNLLWVIRKAPLLHKLAVCGRTNISRAEVAIITESCPMLQEIDFGFCDSLNSLMIQTLSESCPNLQKLNVEGCDEIDRKCLKYLIRCKKLTHLNFSHCMAIDDDGVTFLAKGLPKIVGINLDGINFLTDIAVAGLVKQHEQNLEEVDLDGAEISDASILELSKCQNLRHLGLSFSECLTDTSLDYLKKLRNLENLRLRKGCDFTADGLSTFFKEASLSRLTVLNLSECTSVNDEVVLNIAQKCGHQLRDLTLSWCWFVTDRGLVSIVDHCCNVENLDLLGIDKVKGECLARVPEEMTKLKVLDLRQCNQILDNLILDMVRRKPDLKVINYYGEEFVHD